MLRKKKTLTLHLDGYIPFARGWYFLACLLSIIISYISLSFKALSSSLQKVGKSATRTISLLYTPNIEIFFLCTQELALLLSYDIASLFLLRLLNVFHFVGKTVFFFFLSP